MKQYFGLGSIIGGGAIVLMVGQPGWTQETQVTGVRLSQANGGIQVILDTQNGDRPNIFTVSQGNTLIADATNTRLSLPNGNGFLQNNPAPGISSIMVTQLDANSVRVMVNGETGAPVGQVSQSPNSITLSFAAGANGQIAQSSAPAPPPDSLQAAPLPQTTAQAEPSPPSSDLPVPDVMVPNPTVTVNGTPASSNQFYTPPSQSRAVPPPLGDIAIANIDTTGDTIDLGSSEVVPRLVLRDAPVRDVLSLLGRAAGINVAYIDQSASAGSTPDQSGVPTAPGAPSATAAQTRVSLDIENESVQDVFNYVLRISGLEANRQNRTVFVSPRLPDEARNVVARSLRLNQVSVSDAANVLTAQGAETQVPFTRVEIQTLGEGAAARTVEVRTPEILGLRANRGNGPLLLSGLSVTTDSRLNTVTLIGTPRKVQIASSILAQLDLRQRQVAVNVRIVDVNLIATEDFGTSFSFGIGQDGFFSSDNGAATFNFGPARPPSQADVTGSRLSPPITAAPLPPGVTDAEPFLDAQPDASLGTGSPQSFANPALNDGTIQIDGGTFARPPFGTEDNPLQPGATDITAATAGQGAQVEFSLPTLFQYPTRFLASLRAQIVSGNAKILTDPTIVVQEGERARVQLTQQVPTNVTTTTDSTGGSTITNTTLELSDAGVILDVLVERIDDNGFVTLSVSPEVSAPQETRNFQNTQVTFLAQRILNSGRIRIRDGQTLILSGIIQERDQSTVTKIPILGDIPLLGALFRSTNRENTRNEVIVLLTPQILDDSDRASYGYGYTPGAEVQQILQR